MSQAACAHAARAFGRCAGRRPCVRPRTLSRFAVLRLPLCPWGGHSALLRTGRKVQPMLPDHHTLPTRSVFSFPFSVSRLFPSVTASSPNKNTKLLFALLCQPFGHPLHLFSHFSSFSFSNNLFRFPTDFLLLPLSTLENTLFFPVGVNKPTISSIKAPVVLCGLILIISMHK